jgi:hypothetical protein
MARWEITRQGNKTIVTRKHPVWWVFGLLLMIAFIWANPWLLLIFGVPIACGLIFKIATKNRFAEPKS